MGRIGLEKIANSLGPTGVVPPLGRVMETGVFVVGSLGCGRSSLLGLIARIEDMSGQQIDIDGNIEQDRPLEPAATARDLVGNPDCHRGQSWGFFSAINAVTLKHHDGSHLTGRYDVTHCGKTFGRGLS